jgi:N-acetylmuramoyl-L-alanine amidase
MRVKSSEKIRVSVYLGDRVWLLVALFAAWPGLGCQTRESVGTAPSSSATSSAPPRNRAEAIEQADRMASEAARAPRERAAKLLLTAADIREHLYRTERRTVDALESIELLKSLERLQTNACRARAHHLLLEAELKRDPAQAYRDLYAERVREREPACRAELERALIVLDAYQPLPDVLAELERRAAAAPSSKPMAATGASAASQRSDDPVLPPLPSNAELARVTRVERYGAADAARVVVFVTRPTRFEVGRSDAGGHPRVFVDIENAEFSGASSYEVGGLVERVRLGRQANGTRVVLDLTEAVSRRIFYLPEPFRLVIDVAREQPPKASKRAIRRVVLDPGHGGHDPGATGATGLREKDVVLDIAHRAAPILARELGVSTLLTRDADAYVALDERTARANAFHADLFVSIHCNASEDAAARGVMTFVLDAGQEELAARVAARENAASSQAAAELANAFSRITDPASRAESARFAELLQRAAMSSLRERYADVPNGGVQRAGFYVLAGARMPAALFETSFISNPAGEAHLNAGDFRQKIADAIVNAVRAYRDGL